MDMLFANSSFFSDGRTPPLDAAERSVNSVRRTRALSTALRLFFIQ
jgi:hypothetical protein